MIDLLIEILVLVPGLLFGINGLKPIRLLRKSYVAIPLSVSLIVGSLWQTWRSSRTSDQISSLVNTSIEFQIIPVDDRQEIVPGTPLLLNLVSHPRRNRAENLQVLAAGKVIDGDPNDTAGPTWREFLDQVKTDTRHTPGGDAGVEYGNWQTVKVPITLTNVSPLATGNATVFILAVARWRNVSGTYSQIGDCEYLQHDAVPEVRSGSAIWHICEAPLGDETYMH